MLDGVVNVVKGISFDVFVGECFGIVGELGLGKSQIVFVVMGLLVDNGIVMGLVMFNDMDMLMVNLKMLCDICGDSMLMIFQNLLISLILYMMVGV